MKMSEKTLLKKIEQAVAENYCTGSYKLELQHDYDEASYYVLFYTYEMGETISVDITVTRLGEVKFYSHVHGYYISNFNNHTKSVINVLRMLFDMIDSNKEVMIKYYAIKTEEPEEIEEAEETEQHTDMCEETTETEKHYADYTSEDFIKAGIAKECTTCPDFCEEDCIENAECASGYDVFDGCKTVKEVMEVKQELNARFGKDQYFDTDCEKTSLPCLTCKHFCVRFDNDRIKMTHCVRKNTENYLKAAKNPNWHHVSLRTLANIDNNMLDDKRRLYLTVWGELNKTLKNLHKCNSGLSYERALSPLRRWILELYHNKKITGNFKRYVDIKISMCNVECGVWSSAVEVATGQHESRRYSRPTLRY